MTSLRPATHLGLIREIAGNLELDIERDANRTICGSRHVRVSGCACYRDPGHGGEHHCVCGRHWGDSSALVRR